MQDLPFMFKLATTVTLTSVEKDAMKYTRRELAVKVAQLCGVDTIEQINIQTIETVVKETLHIGEKVIAETDIKA